MLLKLQINISLRSTIWRVEDDEELDDPRKWISTTANQAFGCKVKWLEFSLIIYEVYKLSAAYALKDN